MKRMAVATRLIGSMWLVSVLLLYAIAQQAEQTKTGNNPGVTFERREEMIRMRDGVRLHTVIFTPKDSSEPLPFLINRTPYGVAEKKSEGINQQYMDLVKDGYIFVFQDIRGRFRSEGVFAMNRPPR